MPDLERADPPNIIENARIFPSIPNPYNLRRSSRYKNSSAWLDEEGNGQNKPLDNKFRASASCRDACILRETPR